MQREREDILVPEKQEENMMKAITIHEFGDANVLKYEEVPIPTIGPDEVLVKVHSAGVNPVDWKIRKGIRKDSPNYSFPLILGWDVAGTVESTGNLVTLYKKGDLVFARPDLMRNGTYAEYVA